MFVPGKPRFVPNEFVLCVGHLYSVDNHMGGSHTVQYQGFLDGAHVFRNLGRLLPPEFRFSPDELPANLYIVVPVEKWARDQWDNERKMNGPRYNSHFQAYEAYLPE